MCLGDFNLDEGESRSRGEGLVLMFDLEPQILLYAVLLKHLLLPLGPKQDSRRDGNGHCVFWFWLPKKRQERKRFEKKVTEKEMKD